MTAVIGLDLSLTGTGVARPSGSTYTIKTKTKDGDGRLHQIHQAVLDEIAAAYLGTVLGSGPVLAVLEDLPFSARQAGTTGMVQGVVRLALLRHEVRYAFVSPATLKKFATDNGRADKADMAAALLEHLGRPTVEVDAKGKQFLPGYGIELTDDNQVDAWWLRTAGLTMLGIDTTKQDRLGALAKGKWAGWEHLS